MERRGITIPGCITAAVCAVVLGLAPLIAAEEPSEPEFLGPATPEQILEISPEWMAMYDAYAVDAADATGIREATRSGGDLRIEVIFGSWCSDSLEQVPPLLKILDLAGKEALPATFEGVARSREDRGERFASLKIEAIPTIIVYREEKEIGRIVETPETTLEADLLEILSKPGGP